ncbi:MAG: Vgb family protein [Planctomycetota bacterium]|jgi:DNA-binding beta-propeller fold protein YncE
MNAKMMSRMIAVPAIATALCATTSSQAQSYELEVVADGLNQPTGIAVQGGQKVYFTEVPTPGMPGSEGGMNAVNLLQVASGQIDVLSMGEPEPVNLALGDNSVYWTCRTAGVILERHPNGSIAPLLTGLDQPTGLAADRDGNVYFTQLPTPGVPGSEGGMNTVNVWDGETNSVLSMGEPEPADIAVDRHGTLYWTCRTAGVILYREPGGEPQLLLDGLNQPVGIAVDHRGENLYFTEVPTPGVPGAKGGENAVWTLDLASGELTMINVGDPEPTDVAVARNGDVFWTCTSAGVIVRASRTD